MSKTKETDLHLFGKRQDMFKFRTPPWKETYRKRCLERLRESRNKEQSLRRQICFDAANEASENDTFSGDVVDIDGIMKDEWMKLHSKNLVPAEEFLEELNSEEMFAFYESIHSEIRKELEADLMKEEQRLLNLQELCDSHVEEEEELCSALTNLSTDDVICPLCQKNTLIEHMGVIVCKCGLRINTEQDCITLKNVKDNLATGTSEHSETCDSLPSFHLSQNFGISNLLMTCESCDFLFIIV